MIIAEKEYNVDFERKQGNCFDSLMTNIDGKGTINEEKNRESW